MRRYALLEYTAKVMEVTMNTTADHVVALESALAAPRGPNAVWLPCPPKAAAMSPLLPLCSRHHDDEENRPGCEQWWRRKS